MDKFTLFVYCDCLKKQNKTKLWGQLNDPHVKLRCVTADLETVSYRRPESDHDRKCSAILKILVLIRYQVNTGPVLPVQIPILLPYKRRLMQVNHHQ